MLHFIFFCVKLYINMKKVLTYSIIYNNMIQILNIKISLMSGIRKNSNYDVTKYSQNFRCGEARGRSHEKSPGLLVSGGANQIQ